MSTQTATPAPLWISKLGFESLHPSQASKDGVTMTSTPLVAWAVAPEWVTLHQAAELMGLSYTAETIAALISDGAIVAEEVGGAWLVELQSLSEYRDALWEVLTYED